MSGTSLDGVATALVRLTDDPLAAQLVAFRQEPYGAAERGQIVDTIARGGAKDLALLHVALGERFAGAILQLLAGSGTAPSDVSFVASHGQTIWHEPGRATLQLGDPAVIAERVGVRVVSDFRSRDVAAGGQGAPLVPLADVMLFGHPERGRAGDLGWRGPQSRGRRAAGRARASPPRAAVRSAVLRWRGEGGARVRVLGLPHARREAWEPAGRHRRPRRPRARPRHTGVSGSLARLVFPALRWRRQSFDHEQAKIDAAPAAGVGRFIILGGTRALGHAANYELRRRAARPLL